MVSEALIRSLSDIPEIGDRLERVTENVTGNIVEIGGGEGVNTVRFLRVAKILSKIVVVIDPFEQIPGADESYFKPYTIEKFMENTAGYWGVLYVIRKPSQHPDVPTELEDVVKSCGHIGFIFIDGLQDRESVLSDLKLAESLEVDVICVDDYDRLTALSEVPIAVEQFRMTTKYRFVDIGKREAYFVR